MTCDVGVIYKANRGVVLATLSREGFIVVDGVKGRDLHELCLVFVLLVRGLGNVVV